MGTNSMIYMMKRAAILVALLSSIVAVGVATPALAQQTEVAPEHLAIARKYVDLTDRVSIYEVTLVETAVQTMRTILAQNPEIFEPVDQAISKALESYKDRKGELMDQFARMYALNFTIEELEEIVKFYEVARGHEALDRQCDAQPVHAVDHVDLPGEPAPEFFAQVKANLKEAGYDV